MCEVQKEENMKKLIRFILSAVVGVCVFATPTFAFTQSQANAYFKGVKELGNIQKICDMNGYRSALLDIPLNIVYPQFSTELYGMTDFGNKTIYIGTNQSNAYIEYVTIHEYAHAFSRIENLHVNGVEDILFTEMPNLLWYQMTYNPLNPRATYCMANKDEYFAEAFAMYYFHNKELKQYCPMTYNYIKSMIEYFNGS